jgi:hypothetical protein
MELVIRILAIGPENFFADKWNVADSFIIFISFVLAFMQDSHIDGLVIIWRIFRIATLLNYLSSKVFHKRFNIEIYVKLKSIFETIL